MTMKELNQNQFHALLFLLALDRISSLTLTDQRFEYDKDFNPAGWFRNCYGIVRDSDVPVEKVVIRAFGKEANYLRDLPLHHSQREVDNTDVYSDFEITLSSTADFWIPLVAREATIKIFQPQWLAEEIKNLLLQAAGLYE